MVSQSNDIQIDVNAETGEISERPLTQKEQEQLNISRIEFEAEKAQRAEKAVKRIAALAKLEALGLDEDDLKALGL